jgi:DNA-binding transcriptional MerR regulator
MIQYSVKKLSQLAGVSVRTLHLYDKMGLLKPSVRTEARYRLYGEKELLRLQQILFYRELDFPLKEILEILNAPDFDIINALESHRTALELKGNRITMLLATVDKTIVKLKKGAMLSHEELYSGLSQEKAQAYRNEAIGKWGNEKIEHAENQLRKLSKDEIAILKKEQLEILGALTSFVNQNPQSPEVQAQVGKHYLNIRNFWGTAGSADKQAEAYAGLGQLYADDERYTITDGKSNMEFALFMKMAIFYFTETTLK